MLKELINLANHLDKKGFRKEADYLDAIINKKAIGPMIAVPAIPAVAAGAGLVSATLIGLGITSYVLGSRWEDKLANFYLDIIFKRAYLSSLERHPELESDERIRREAIINSGGEPDEAMINDLAKADIRVGQQWILDNSENLPDIPEEDFRDKAYNWTPESLNVAKKNALEAAIQLSDEAFMKL